MKKVLLFISFAAFLMTACDKKEILPGKREDIFASQEKQVDGHLAALTITPSSPVALSSYTEIGGNKQHRHMNYELKANPKLIWKKNIGRGPIASDPVFFENKIYVVDALGTLSCVSAKDGELIWKKEIARQPDESVFSGGLAVHDGILFVSTNIGTVHAINPKDQKEIWKRDLKSPLKGAPFVSNGRLFITSIDNTTFSLNTKTGKTIWTKTIDKEQTMMSEFGTIALFGDDVICPYSSGDILSLEASTGSENWSDVLFSSDISASGFTISHISASPVVFDNYLLVATSESKMVLIDATSGIRVWEQGIGTIRTPIVNSGWIFVLTSDKNLVCLSAQNGEFKWQTALPSLCKSKNISDGTWTGPLMINGDIVIFGSNGDILTFDVSTGKLKNSKNFERAAFGRTPIVVNKTMYFVSDRAELYAVG